MVYLCLATGHPSGRVPVPRLAHGECGMRLILKGNVFVNLGQRVLLEEVVVAVGEIGAVVAAARFFAGQGGAGHERSQGVEIGEFVVMAAGMFGERELHVFEEGDGGGEFFAVAHDADVAPHQVADLCEGCRYGGCGQCFVWRDGNGPWGFCGV